MTETNGKKRPLTAREVAERHGWCCINGCANVNGVYPTKFCKAPTFCPKCHEQFVRVWQREQFLQWKAWRALDFGGGESVAHVVDYREMRTGFQHKNMDEEEKRYTKKLLRRLGVKNLDMLLSEVRGLKQKMRNEARAARAKTTHWEEEFT